MTITEFQNITLIDNIPSVLRHGILSHTEAKKVQHLSVALQAVQEKRDVRKVPGGFALHEYANIYFDARNPMMSKRRNEAQRLCVLRISPAVLDIPGTVITDQNAASKYVRFLAPAHLRYLDLDYICARNWKHPGDQIEEWRHSSAKCAEVLIPQRIPSEYLVGAYVVDDAAQRRLAAQEFRLPIHVNSDIFFH